MTGQHRAPRHLLLDASPLSCPPGRRARRAGCRAAAIVAVGFMTFYAAAVGQSKAFERAPIVATCYSPDPRPSQEAS